MNIISYKLISITDLLLFLLWIWIKINKILLIKKSFTKFLNSTLTNLILFRKCDQNLVI